MTCVSEVFIPSRYETNSAPRAEFTLVFRSDNLDGYAEECFICESELSDETKPIAGVVRADEHIIRLVCPLCMIRPLPILRAKLLERIQEWHAKTARSMIDAGSDPVSGHLEGAQAFSLEIMELVAMQISGVAMSRSGQAAYEKAHGIDLTTIDRDRGPDVAPMEKSAILAAALA